MEIKINNDITIQTLKKIYKTQEWWRKILDNASEDNQFMENLDNDFITENALKIIVDEIFKENSKGGFRKSLECFGTRSKKRFIKQKLSDLFKNQNELTDDNENEIVKHLDKEFKNLKNNKNKAKDNEENFEM